MSLAEATATRAAVALVVIRRTAQKRNAFRLESPTRTPPAEERVTVTREEATLEEPGIAEHAKSRWSVFVAYGLLAAATQALVVNYAPVTDDAARHFGVSVASIGWLSQVFPLIYVLLAIPAGLTLDRFFRPALIAGALLTACGAFLRLVADDFTWALIGQVVAAVGQPFVLNAIPGLAVGYLAVKDRAVGIAAASSATFGGMVVGYLLGACLPGDRNIHALTIITALLALDAGLCLLGALHFSQPRGGDEAMRVTGGLRAFRTAFGNRYLRRLCAVVAIPMGTFIALATFVQPLLEPAGVSESTAGLILAFTMIAGVIGCAAVPVWANRHRREVQIMGVGIGFTAVACLHLALVPSTTMAFLTLIGVGFLLLPALPIVLALSERHAPDAESTAAGLIWMAGNLGGVVIATAVGLLVTHPATAFLALAAATLLAMPALRWFDRL
ncbi:MFS transporter [Mycolicibacterium brisbanense]|uniref:Putative major facilitator superfamily transporter n=1 Tax=Mycolicibacterium brisbanense TaxID=146020 RepID=A0A100W208_9MYCO|nr:MFS transporter [Mycolicibacterium brisbanense]MCV7157507.1 MFS transporter [Mycolicibacterium brisbanense]GAS90146.1 putative major facilitator superfamily transporter [Mycolicibacterium brisbanense]